MNYFVPPIVYLSRPMLGRFTFGALIAVGNLLNMERKKKQDKVSQMRYIAASVCKGFLYGATFPVSLVIVASDAANSATNEPQFLRHVVPLSVRGSVEDRAERTENENE